MNHTINDKLFFFHISTVVIYVIYTLSVRRIHTSCVSDEHTLIKISIHTIAEHVLLHAPLGYLLLENKHVAVFRLTAQPQALFPRAYIGIIQELSAHGA